MIVMSMVFTAIPGMTSQAAEAEGETDAAASELQDENIQRLEEVTAMDEDGTIYEISDSDGTIDEDTENVEESISMFSLRSVSPKVVNFNTKGNAVTTYNDETNGIQGYTNGAYGADAAYLGTTSDGRIRFMLSGVTGTVSASEVEVVDYDFVADNVSYYTVSNGKLIHYISQDLNHAPTSSVHNGYAPSYLSESGRYYSYDGHYFYTDYNVMLSDYQNDSNGASAINAGNPFYNYFQFLDMNSHTGYSGEELDGILSSAMTNVGIDPASSKLTGTGNNFVAHQNTYSVNALLSLGIAINESSWGRSNICLTKNNIFGLNAVDSSPDDAYAFASIDDCIREFMNYQMTGAYLKDGNWCNHGEYLGNKGGGINVSYASDPYWGEKAAALAWNMDVLGGSRDYLGTDTGNTVPDETIPDTDTTLPDETAPETSDENSALPDESTTVNPDEDNTIPDVSEPVTPGTDNPEPDISAPETSDTDNPEPDASEPDISGTDNTVPDTSEPITSGADNAVPDGSDTDTSNTSNTATDPQTPDISDSDKTTADLLASGTSDNDAAANSQTSDISDDGTPTDSQMTNASDSNSTSDNGTQASAKSPKTGDLTDTALWIALLSCSMVVLISGSAIIVRKKYGR